MTWRIWCWNRMSVLKRPRRLPATYALDASREGERAMAVEPRPTIQSGDHNGVIPLQAVVSSLVGSKVPPPPSQPAMGFFTDTSLCIGCKACEVACRQWNQLPAKEAVWTGSSYDNTGELSAITWRHVQFIERIGRGNGGSANIDGQVAQAKLDGIIPMMPPGTALPFFNTDRW